MKRIDADAVVVGSGAGGGTIAARLGPLARKGRRVLVLEQGPRHDYRDFNGRELDMAEKLYRDGGAFMVADGTVSLAFAEGYGGSTVVYTGTSLEPPYEIVEGWRIPGLDPAELVARTVRYAHQNGVHYIPDDALNDNNRLFAVGCERLGWKARRFPVNIDGCRGSSLCNLGCPNNAKQGTHVVQLPRAEADGVEVVTGARVKTVFDTGVEVEVSGDQEAWPSGSYRIKADTVVICGGAVNSPALLLRSGFRGELPALGRYFTCQPAHILVGEHERPISNAVGHPKSYVWDERIREDRAFLEVCMYFPFVTAKNMTGFGHEHEAFMRAFGRLQMILVLACDDALPNHRVAIDGAGEPVVHYRLTDPTVQGLVNGTRAAAHIFFAAGARAVHAPSARPTRLVRDEAERVDHRIAARHFKRGTVSVSAAHLMGGCRMGRGPSDSVTDGDGCIHGHPGLFVADASLFPTALEANPYLTIMGLADRVADAVIDRLGG